jgi:hypothetical protein
MSRNRRTRSRRNKSSSLDEFVKLAGDIVEDGVTRFMGEIGKDPSVLEYSSDEESKSEEEQSDSSSEEDEELRRRREQEAEIIRRHKEIGEDREKDLRERLSKLEDLYGMKDTFEPEEKPRTNVPKKPVKKVYGKVRKAPRPEEQTFQVVYEEEESSLHKIIDPEDADDATWDEDDYAEQRVHEMMQLLHHCQKTKEEAQRLIGYKKMAIQHHREVHHDLEAQIARIVNHRKLEISTRRFMSYMKNGDMPRTLETLEMEKRLLENIQSMKLMAEESNNMSLMHHEFISLVDAAE